MKPGRGFLISLALNMALVVILAWIWRPRREDTPRPESASATSVVSRAGTEGAEGKPETRVESGDESPFRWSSLPAEDWAAYRDRLLALGCPRSTVRVILEPLINRKFAERARAEMRGASERFWEIICPPSKEKMEAFEARVNALDEERKRMLEALFPGGEGSPAFHALHEYDSTLSFLAPDVRERLSLLEQQHAREMDALENKGDGTDAKKREEAAARLTREYEDQLAVLLSPEEREELRLRRSSRSRVRNLEGVELSAEEMARIMRLRETGRPAGAGDPAEVEAANQLVRADLKVLLGERRFAELERAEQPGFQNLFRLVQRLGVDTGVAGMLWDQQSEIEAAAKSVGENPGLGRAVRVAELTRLEGELKRKAEAVLPDARSREAWWQVQAEWRRQWFAVPPENPIDVWMGGPDQAPR